jgi:hypothetical protein
MAMLAGSLSSSLPSRLNGSSREERSAGHNHLIPICGQEAARIVGECLPAFFTAKRESHSVPCRSNGHIGVDEHLAHRVGFAVRAYRAVGSYLDEADRIGNPLEPLCGQRNKLGAWHIGWQCLWTARPTERQTVCRAISPTHGTRIVTTLSHDG